MLAASPALAATTCTKSGNVLTVSADPNATLVRSGDDITVSGVTCTAGSTVNDIDQIDITSPNPGSGAENVTIDMSGGKFAPGLNNETTGQSEIEITVDLRDGANTLTILGTGTSDRWAFTAQGIDLNNDGDADVTGKSNGGGGFANLVSPNLAVTANGQGGNDTFIQKESTKEVLIGGDGQADTVEYKLRTAATTVTLDGTANDGEGTEGDNVNPDIEILRGGSGNDNYTGTVGTQLLYGYLGDDTLNGLDGSDALNGGSGITVSNDGADTLNGGPGQDNLNGGSNVDALDGGNGRDNITDGAGNDVSVLGGLGRDQFFQDASASASGNDVLDGGDGNDTVIYTRRTTTLNVTLDGTANDGASGETDNVMATIENVQSGRGSDTIDTSAGTGRSHNVAGNAGNDIITGADLADNLSGGEGTDTLNGGAGGDKLFGGDAADTINAGGGNDSLFGGDGNDQMHGDQGNDRHFGGSDSDLCEDPNSKTFRTGCESK
jgi:hypothetical protein